MDTDANANNAGNESHDAADAAAKELQRKLQELHEYRTALEQEFAGITSASNSEEVNAKAMDAVLKLVPDAGETIAFLLNHGDSESVRANLAKWVFDKAIARAKENGEDDELTKLVKSMTGKNSSKDKEPADA